MANRFFRSIPDLDPADERESIPAADFARHEALRRRQRLVEAEAPTTNPARTIEHPIPGFDY